MIYLIRYLQMIYLQGVYTHTHTHTHTYIYKRRKWQPTPVFLPGESHGWRSLVGYSPRGHKESDMTERLHFHFIYTHTTCSLPLDGIVTRQHYRHMSPVVNSAAITRGTCTPVCVSLQSCLILCDSVDCSPPDSSVQGTLQARILEWAAMPFSRASSQPRD